MNLEIYLQAIATIFVGITILLAYRQLKEANRHLQTSVGQNVTNYQREFWGMFFENEELLKWYLKSRNIEVSPEFSENKIIFYATLKMDFFENLYLQKKENNLAEEAWKPWFHAMKLDMRDQYFKRVWDGMSRNGLYADSFITMVENEILLKSENN